VYYTSHSILDLYHKIFENGDKFSVETDATIWLTFIKMSGSAIGSVGILLWVGTILIEFSQVGFILNFEKVSFKLSNLDLFQGLSKILGARNGKVAPLGLLMELIQLLILGTFVFWGLWFFVWSYTLKLISANFETLTEIILISSKLVLNYSYFLLAVALIYAAYKYYESRCSIRKQLMMSFNELKQEMKEDEGDPQTKHERKSIHHEMMLHGVLESVKKAKVVISDI
jgi:type III secretion protein U